MSETASINKPTNCPYCGLIHDTTCSRIKAIEYHPNGAIKRVEFVDAQPVDWSRLLVGSPVATPS